MWEMKHLSLKFGDMHKTGMIGWIYAFEKLGLFLNHNFVLLAKY